VSQNSNHYDFNDLVAYNLPPVLPWLSGPRPGPMPPTRSDRPLVAPAGRLCLRILRCPRT
jgi:hypothetical protein